MKTTPSFGRLGRLAGLLVAASVAVLSAPASAQLSLTGSTPGASANASVSGGPLALGGLPSLTPVTGLLNGDLLTSVQKVLYGGRNDPFYDVNGVSTAGKKPGDILKSRTVLAPLYPEATVTQVMYVSTDHNGKLVPVTGTVLVPRLDLSGLVNLPLSVQGPLPTLPVVGELLGANLGVPVGGPKYKARPVVGITPGTRGMGNHCAPSQGFNAATISPLMVDYSVAEYHQLLLRGYVVAVTDYIGGGTQVPEPYLVGRPEGMAGLDVVRAALNLPNTGATKADSMIGLTGYSQGGQAAAWAAQLQPTYAPELNMKGVVAGGVVTDMNDLVDFFNQGGLINSGVLLAIMVGYDNAYPELNLKNYVKNDQAKKLFEAARTQCVYQELLAYPGLRSSDVTSPDFAQLPQFRARLKEQLLGTIAPRVPMYVYHGQLDNIVPYQFGERLRNSWCAQGATVEFRSGPYEHMAGIFLGAPGGVQFLADRFAGKAPISNCTAGGGNRF